MRKKHQMAQNMFVIEINQHFNAEPSDVFPVLSDHEHFGKLVGANIRRIQQGQAPFANGMGSVRRIHVFPGVSFEETITDFLPGQLIEYKVTKGSPIKNHVGTLRFSSPSTGQTLLNYTIVFEPKLPVPGWGSLLRRIIEQPIRKGLADYANALSKA